MTLLILAAESAKLAEEYAEKSGCPLDIEAVQIRLKAITVTQDRNTCRQNSSA